MGELRQVTTAIFGHWIRAPGISGGPSQFCLGEYKPRGHSSNIVYSRHQEIFKFWRGGFARGYILDACNLFNIDFFFESAILFLK